MALLFHFCLQKLHKLPHEILGLPLEEQAFLCASVAAEVERRKEEARKMRPKRRRR